MKLLYKCEFCSRIYEVEKFAHQCETACKKKSKMKKK